MDGRRSPLGHRSDAPVDVPALVGEIAAGDPITVVWANEAGGLTFEVGSGDRRRFVKWSPPGAGGDLAAEAARLRWAHRHASVPRVVDALTDDRGSALVTAPLPGENAVSDRLSADPATAVRAIGAGLRHLHDRLPVESCPFTWSLDERIGRARDRVAEDLTTPHDWHPEHRHLTPDAALALLSDPPTVDRLVVCHGDACAPNTLVEGGECSGHVDLGSLGVADRWADLAIATWSTEWNYGPGWDAALLSAYGVEADEIRTAYYRLLWDLT